MMRREKTTPIGISRRRFLAASGAAVLASGIKFSPAQAQPGEPFVRKSLLDPQIGPVLDSYRKAITAMLQLPATDPRNWYRLAFIHALDCPHGNWWFLPWHRGYIGWFEQICRQLSGDPTFALPYWDWTATPSLPAPFGDNSVLNPSNPAFIDSLQNFSNQFANPVTTMYQNFTQAQQAQLQLRPGNEDAPTFLAQITSTDPDSQEFFPIAECVSRRSTAVSLKRSRSIRFTAHSPRRHFRTSRVSPRPTIAEEGNRIRMCWRVSRTTTYTAPSEASWHILVPRRPDLLHAPFKYGSPLGRVDQKAAKAGAAIVASER